MPDNEERVHDKMPEDSERRAHSYSQPHPLHPSWRNPWVILSGVVIVAFILFWAGSFRLTKTLWMQANGGPARMLVGPGGQVTKRLAAGRTGAGGFIYGARANLVSGVVTAVNGSTLTVAGDGTTHSVATTSSTTYTNALSAAVDDTVIATGSTSGSTFTATNIIVDP